MTTNICARCLEESTVLTNGVCASCVRREQDWHWYHTPEELEVDPHFCHKCGEPKEECTCPKCPF